MTRRRYARRALLIVGLLLTMGPGVPFAALWWQSARASRVSECRISYSHRNTLIVSLESGDTVFLTSENLPDVRRCLALGTAVEKRRGELGYHIGGRYQPPTEDLVPAVVMVAVGLVLLLIRVLFVRAPPTRRPAAGTGNSDLPGR